MLLLSVVIVVAVAFAWFTLRDINRPSTVPVKKVDEVPTVAPEVKHIEEVVPVTKTKKAKGTSTEKVKKTPGRKKKSQ